MPRAVLDTNVLVAALITPRGASARLLIELRAGAYELIISPLLLAELRDVLARDKFRRYVTSDEADRYLELIRQEGVTHDDPAPTSDPAVADPDDAFLIDLARAARADALVSGDRQLLELRHAAPVMTAAQFLASLRDSGA